MKDEQLNALASALARLTDKQIVEVIERVVRTRPVSESDGHLLLARAYREEGEEVWMIEVLAYANPRKYPEGWGDDAPICQAGTCSSCEQTFSCWAKHAVCPVCGAEMYGT